jgi:uncharacterized membrane protein
MNSKLSTRKFATYAVIAAVINSIIFLIAKSADATMVVNQGGSRSITLIMVFGASFFGLLAAAFVAAKIGNKSQKFLSNAPVIGLVFGVVTAIAPFTVSDDSKTAVALASNHIVAGVVWYFGAKRSTK